MRLHWRPLSHERNFIFKCKQIHPVTPKVQKYLHKDVVILKTKHPCWVPNYCHDSLQWQYLLDQDQTQVFQNSGLADFCIHDLCVWICDTDRPAKMKANFSDNDKLNDYVWIISYKLLKCRSNSLLCIDVTFKDLFATINTVSDFSSVLFSI